MEVRAALSDPLQIIGPSVITFLKKTWWLAGFGDRCGYDDDHGGSNTGDNGDDDHGCQNLNLPPKKIMATPSPCLFCGQPTNNCCLFSLGRRNSRIVAGMQFMNSWYLMI